MFYSLKLIKFYIGSYFRFMELESNKFKKVFVNIFLIIAIILSLTALQLSLSLKEETHNLITLINKIDTEEKNNMSNFQILENKINNLELSIKKLNENNSVKLDSEFINEKELIIEKENHIILTNSYIIKKGDTFTSIANELGLNVMDLLNMNKSINPRSLIPGQEINVPSRN